MDVGKRNPDTDDEKKWLLHLVLSQACSVFSEWFEVRTVHDPPQVGTAETLPGLSPQTPARSAHQSIRHTDISQCLPVLVHGQSILKGMGLPAAPSGFQEATFREGASSPGSAALALSWFLRPPIPLKWHNGMTVFSIEDFPF